ncbi:MAG: DMT family transporter [Clostridiales bacterium]|jgi:drug/metabolite transporter (DMT)-like permease|nr:DMT family transporter [Clostridiales bacterium]
MTKKNRKAIIASLGLLLTAMIWGFAFVVVKDSLDTMPPIYMLAIRFTIASLGLCVIFRKKLRLIDKAMLKSGAVLGTLIYLGYATQTIGCKYTTAGKNAFLTTVYVVMVPFLHWLFNKRRPDIFCTIAAFIAIIGIGLISLNDDLSVNIGDALTLLCGLCFAIHIVFVERYTEKQDPVTLTVVQMVVSALLSWLSAPFLDGNLPLGIFNSGMIGSMLYLGLLSTMLAFLLQLVCQKYTPASVAALLLSMEAVFGVIFSTIFLKETLYARMVIGCFVLFFAIIMAETKFEFLKKVGISKCKKINASSSEQEISKNAN